MIKKIDVISKNRKVMKLLRCLSNFRSYITLKMTLGENEEKIVKSYNKSMIIHVENKILSL